MQRFSTKVNQIRSLTPEVLCLSLAVPERFEWSPGQYVGVSDSANGTLSYYSIASAPAKSSRFGIELAIHGPSIKWAAPIRVGMELYLSDPEGGPKLNDWYDAERLILIGMGTGVAPLRAIVRSCLFDAEEVLRPAITLIQGARNLSSCLFYEEFMGLTHSGLNYIPVLSQPLASNTWLGKTGRVQSHLHELQVAGSRFCVCGKLDMVTEVVALLATQGASGEQVFSEGY